MQYLDKKSSINAIKKMAKFESSLKDLYGKFNMDLRSNLGRRNMLLSQAQELFFSDEIRNNGFDVTCSGKTGEPDIIIESMKKEVECKLTSGSRRSWSLQCDYSTLQKKKCLDFLYVLCDEEFKNFAVLLFENLTIDDFYPPSPGSRQKSRMKKHIAMNKCKILHGKVANKRNRLIYQYSKNLIDINHEERDRINHLDKRLAQCTTEKQREKISGIISREKSRYKTKESKILDKIDFWKKSIDQYEISLSGIECVH